MPSEIVHQVEATIQTTDATVTTICSYTLPDACAALVRGYAAGRRPSNGDSTALWIERGVKRHGGGGATLIGSGPTTRNYAQIGSNLTLATSGNDILLQVTGAAATTIEWMAILEIIPLYVP